MTYVTLTWRRTDLIDYKGSVGKLFKNQNQIWRCDLPPVPGINCLALSSWMSQKRGCTWMHLEYYSVLAVNWSSTSEFGTNNVDGARTAEVM